MRRRANLTTFLVMIVFLLDSSGFWHLARAKGPQADKAEEKKKTIAQLPAGANGSWWTAVQDQIRRAEYKIRWQEHTGLEDLEGAYQAPNRVQNLRTYFAPEGIRIIQRTECSPSWQWGLRLTRYGYAGAAKAVAEAKQVVSGNRIEYRRGDVVEWYVNDEKGLEQGFTLTGPPEGNEEETQKEIVLDMSVAGDLKGRMSKDGRTVTFATSEGKEVINYDGLIAKDAAGRELGSRISLGEDRIILKIDTNGARYPVTIDPVITSTPATADWTAEGNQNAAFFGRSVSTAGDVNGDGFDDVIVGAYYYDNGQADEGAAFVYHGSASGLSASPNWTAESNQAGAHFGWSVATAGDVNGDGFSDVVVGAESYGSGGAAFVYHGSATGLSASPDWTAVCDDSKARFGRSVATAGDVNGDGFSDVIVGAQRYGYGGATFVYHGSASGLSVDPNWTAGGNPGGFGHSVSTAGDVNGDGFSDIIVGAPYYNINPDSHEGKAFVYHGSASGLSAEPDWTAQGDGWWELFGYSVSTAGDVNGDGFSDVIVGTNYAEESGQNPEEKAFVYHGSASGLSASPDWIADDNGAGPSFGSSVSTAGDVNGDGFSDVIVGANVYNYKGGAFVYYGSGLGLSIGPDWIVEGDQTLADFGYSVAAAGDVNGDGFDDVIVGAFFYDNGQTNEGKAFVYYGSASGLSADPNWTAESDQADAHFGWSVATAGDVNGDSFADVIVGAKEYFNGESGEGAAFVYHGSASGLSLMANWMADSDQVQARFGYSVSTAGDVNGDGYSDVIVGAFDYDGGQLYEGAAFVFHGSVAGLSSIANWMADSDQAYANFGWSVSTAGDVNGDGFSDVIVGARYYDSGQHNEGKVFLYHGSTSGLSADPAWTAEGNEAEVYFGGSVATAGDVNGDGFCDVIVGSSGMAFVYHGSAAGLSASANWTALGSSVETAGDVNGDGYADVITGSSEKAFVYYGSATGLSAGPVWTLEGKQDGAGFGSSVGTAGDVNGDGLTDVIVGAYLYDNGQSNEGAAFVYYGRCWLKADLTGDCSIDYFDFSKLAKDWLQPSLVVDLTADSFVDYFDLDVLALYWLGENNPPPGAASNPNPPDGASTANYNADLSWTASLFTKSHDVYFGTSSPPPFIGNQTATTFDPGTMTIGAKYYWRVNEVGPYATTRGNVWSFTIMPPPPPPPI